MREARHDEWQIIPDASDDEAVVVLERDRIWNSFALADLAPPFRVYSQIALARRGSESAALLILRSPGLSVLSPYGAEAGVAAILELLALPAVALLQAQPAHLALLRRHYRLLPGKYEALRMAVTAATFRPPANVPAVARLTPADAGALMELYALSPENHFRPDLLEQGVFYGVYAGPAGADTTAPPSPVGKPALRPAPAGQETSATPPPPAGVAARPQATLLAVGGTHVVAPAYGVAVLGGILTHPVARRHGYATAITAALTSDLLARGCRDVVLNVVADNAPAISVYTRLGFQVYARYWTAQAERRRPRQT